MPAASQRDKRPVLAISMGDPAGIGPEVTLRALALPKIRRAAKPILVGIPEVYHQTAAKLGLKLSDDIATVPLDHRSHEHRTYGTDGTYEPGLPRSRRARAACGEAAHAAILAATRLVQEGRAAALVTAPISKEHVALAGHDFPGHTELLAHLAGDVPVRMMLAGPKLRVVLVTIHMALAEVPRRITSDLVLETVRLTHRALRDDFGIAKPRIAVAGLNPHAGEGGLFGDEEGRVLVPALRRARRAGIEVDGPAAADGIFAHAVAGTYDAVVCMYHDQGLGPFKLLHFADGVNVTLGLPFVRTSPDHGTAFDLAGRGVADPSSMAAAILLAAELATRRRPAVDQSRLAKARRIC